jgi:lipopolysaccharide/colanic/teichoic acid biosynthesis glycosyltransferase
MAAVPPSQDAAVEESISERYARMAGEVEDGRSIDAVLRGLDLLIAGAALLVLAPLMALIALGLWATAGSPVLYRGQRIGRAGRPFTMLKFRTLRADAENRLGPYLGAELTALTAGETTRLGRLLRETQLDELPQLVSVLSGRMSIVGPRPIRPLFFEELCQEIPQYWQRLVVRPGLTGLAQLRLTREMTWAEKLAHDFEYIADRSLRLYVDIILKTTWLVFLRPTSAVWRGDAR